MHAWPPTMDVITARTGWANVTESLNSGEQKTLIIGCKRYMLIMRVVKKNGCFRLIRSSCGDLSKAKFLGLIAC